MPKINKFNYIYFLLCLLFLYCFMLLKQLFKYKRNVAVYKLNNSL